MSSNKNKNKNKKHHHPHHQNPKHIERRPLLYASLGASFCATTYVYFGTVLDLHALVHAVLFLVLFSRNAYSFFLFGNDKFLAMNQKFRISERELIKSCEWCGFVGGIFGMMLFAHKVRKLSFLRQVVEKAATSGVLAIAALVVSLLLWGDDEKNNAEFESSQH